MHHQHPPPQPPHLTEKQHKTDMQANNNNWQHKANCKNQTHHMFPKTHKDTTYIPNARKICNNCTVQKQCLEYALTYPAADMHGVWAGLTGRQLAAEQRRRNITPTKPTLAAMWNILTKNRPNN